MSTRKETKLLFESWRSYVKKPLNEGISAEIKAKILSNPTGYVVQVGNEAGDAVKCKVVAVQGKSLVIIDPDTKEQRAIDDAEVEKVFERKPSATPASGQEAPTATSTAQKAGTPQAPPKPAAKTPSHEGHEEKGQLALMARGILFNKGMTGLSPQATATLYGFLLPYAKPEVRDYIEKIRVQGFNKEAAKLLKRGDFIFEFDNSRGTTEKKTAVKDTKGKTVDYREPGLDKFALASFAGLEPTGEMEEKVGKDGKVIKVPKLKAKDLTGPGADYKQDQLDAFDDVFVWLYENLRGIKAVRFSKAFGNADIAGIAEKRKSYIGQFFNIGKGAGRAVGQHAETAGAKQSTMLEQVRQAGIPASLIPDDHILTLTNSDETGISTRQFAETLCEGGFRGVKLLPDASVDVYTSNDKDDTRFIKAFENLGVFVNIKS